VPIEFLSTTSSAKFVSSAKKNSAKQMIYKISSTNPSSRYLQVEATTENSERKNIEIQLPAWRPGRYELGNFSKNVRNLRAYDSTLKELKVTKNTKD